MLSVVYSKCCICSVVSPSTIQTSIFRKAHLGSLDWRVHVVPDHRRLLRRLLRPGGRRPQPASLHARLCHHLCLERSSEGQESSWRYNLDFCFCLIICLSVRLSLLSLCLFIYLFTPLSILGMWYLNGSAFFVQLGFYVSNWQNVDWVFTCVTDRTSSWILIY